MDLEVLNKRTSIFIHPGCRLWDRPCFQCWDRSRALHSYQCIRQAWGRKDWTQGEWWRDSGSLDSHEEWADGMDEIRTKLNFCPSQSEIKLFEEKKKNLSVVSFLFSLLQFCALWRLENLRWIKWRKRKTSSSIISRLEKAKPSISWARGAF